MGKTGSKHENIVNRLIRIAGQVSGIRKMQEGRRYSVDVLDRSSAPVPLSSPPFDPTQPVHPA